MNLTDELFEETFVNGRKGVLRKRARHALQRDRAALRSMRRLLRYLTALSGRCKEDMEEYWWRAEARSRLVRHASAERGLNHLAISGGDFTRKALTSKAIRLAAYRLLRRLHDRR